MRVHGFLISVFAVCAYAMPASAQMIVVGGAGQSCYEAADQQRHDAVRLCTIALESGNLSKRDRSATYINRAYALLKAAQPKEALPDCIAALAIDPSLGEAYLNQGVAMMAMKRPSEALPLINKSIEVGFDKMYLGYFNRAIAKEDTGDVKGAYYDYKKALELEPKFVLAETELKRFSVTTR